MLLAAAAGVLSLLALCLATAGTSGVVLVAAAGATAGEVVFRGVLLGLPTLGLVVMLCLVVPDVVRSAREAFREG